MYRRFHDLMQRYALVREWIDAEKRRHAPNLLRLARLRTLQYKIRETITAFVKDRATRRASRPRLVYMS